MFGQGFNYGFLGKPLCFTDTTDIFKDNSGVALYTLDYDASDSGNATGKFSEAAVFNGSSSYISTGINFSTLPNTKSISMWIKSTGSSTVGLGGMSGSSTNNGLFSFDEPAGNVAYIPSFGGYHTGNASTVITNQWNHFVVTDTNVNGNVKMYINGSEVTVTKVNSFVYATNTNMQIGRQKRGNGTTFWQTGTIDQVRIFNKEISSSEVTTLYNETKNTTNTLQVLGDTSCIATYTFDGSSTDLSGNYNGTDTNILYKYDGTPSNVDFGVEGKINYGARFKDATDSFISTSLLFTGTGAKSFSFWFKANSVSSANSAFYFSNNGGRIDVHIAGTGSNTPSANYQTVSINSTTAITGWNFVTLVFSGWLSSYSSYSYHGPAITCKVYLNGGSVQTVSPLPYNGSKELHLGGLSGNSSNYDGELDQFRVFNKELSTDEIDTLYAETACVYTSTTDNIALPITNTAYYKLDNDSKDSAKSRGKFNQGATFVGNSAGIVNTTLQLSSTAHSVSLWMKPQDLTATKWQIMFFSAFNGYPSFTLGKRPDQTTSFHYRNESSNEVYFTLSNANTWYHVVVTRNNSGSTVYVNGSSVATDSNSMGTYPSSAYQKASIGSNPNYPAEYFDGTLDQIRVYDVALTSTDVANLYNSETTSTTNTLAFPTGKTAIATYTLDGNGVDVSGNYSGSEGDNIVYAYDGTDTNIEYRFGRFGQAAVFNGTDSKIDTGAAIVSNQSAFSFSAWVNFDNLSTHNMIISNSESSGNGQLMMYGWTDGNIYFQPDSTSSSNRGYLSTSGLMTTNQWVHIVMVFDGSATGNSNRLKVYIQGEEKTLTYGGTIPSSTGTVTNNTYIGGRGSQSHSFHGAIDQVRIYDAALTSGQVTKLYNEKPEVDTSNFKTVLWNGDGSSETYVSNVGMDLETYGGLVWAKARQSQNHTLYDSVRGVGKYIASDTANTESTSTTYGQLTSFDANGFTGSLGSNGTYSFFNSSTQDYVSWVWKGGGAAISNTDGTITSQVSANTNAGFSIVKYTGNGANATVGHGLTSAPELIITKGLTTAYNWNVSSSLAPNGYLQLNTTDGLTSVSTRYIIAGATTNSLTNYVQFNQNNIEHIAYCFHSVAGYSKIGTYSGSGVASKEVVLDFNPSFVIIKRTDATTGWVIVDDKRGTKELYPNVANQEDTSTTNIVLGTNKFTLNSTGSWYNASGGTYLYIAFK